MCWLCGSLNPNSRHNPSPRCNTNPRWSTKSSEYTETVCFIKLTLCLPKSWFILRGSFIKHILLSFFFSSFLFFLKTKRPFIISFSYVCLSVCTCSLPRDFPQPAMKSVPPRKTQCTLITSYIILDIMIPTSEVGTQIQAHSIIWFLLVQITFIYCLLYLEILVQITQTLNVNDN